MSATDPLLRHYSSEPECENADARWLQNASRAVLVSTQLPWQRASSLFTTEEDVLCMGLEISIVWDLKGDAVNEDEEVINESKNGHSEGG